MFKLKYMTKSWWNGPIFVFFLWITTGLNIKKKQKKTDEFFQIIVLLFAAKETEVYKQVVSAAPENFQREKQSLSLGNQIV